MKNRYDNLLNDRADEIIKDYKKSIFLLIVFSVILGIVIIAQTISITRLTVKNHSEKVTEEPIIEEVPFSLEYNIGYWTIHKPDEVNDSSLYVFLVENGAWYPDILLRHAKLESGNYTSNVYRNNNNLFGMKKVSRRPTTQIGANSYGIYKNWCLSALDRILWDIDHFKTKPTRSDYLKAFNTYGEDPNYINKVK